MSDTTANIYTEAQHFALLTSAVERETASMSEAKEALTAQVGTLESEKAALADELADAKSRIDVVEAEKAAAEARADAAAKELVDFKAELALQAEIAEKKVARVEAVKAANSSLGTDYFTEARAQRWAEMSDDAFELLVADLTEAAAAAKKAKTDEKPSEDMVDGEKSAETAKETAAFSGGETATSIQGETTLATFLGAKRRGSAA